MKGNEHYNDVAAVVNSLDLAPHELTHVVLLMVAQLPDVVIPQAHAHFATSDKIEVENTSEPLTRLNAGVEPDVDHVDPDIQGIVGQLPEENEIPTVLFYLTDQNDVYVLDKMNTQTLTEFHHKSVPSEAIFEREGKDVLIRWFQFTNIRGRFSVHYQRNGESLVHLMDGFTVNSFVLIKVQLTTRK